MLCAFSQVGFGYNRAYNISVLVSILFLHTEVHRANKRRKGKEHVLFCLSLERINMSVLCLNACTGRCMKDLLHDCVSLILFCTLDLYKLQN
jgi:hypothetical protein